MVHILGERNSIFNVFISELRNVSVQQDSMRFRRNLERIGEIIGYELSKKLNYANREIETPLGIADMSLPTEEIVLGTILRAGLPMHQGILNYFDGAQNAFISAYRKHHKDGTFDIQVEYLSSPPLEGKVLILCDPMLATGQSMVLAWKALTETMGKPKHTHFVAALGSEEGVSHTRLHMPENATLWVGAVDPELNAKSYIIPGLGDAGDLAYGPKM